MNRLKNHDVRKFQQEKWNLLNHICWIFVYYYWPDFNIHLKLTWNIELSDPYSLWICRSWFSHISSSDLGFWRDVAFMEPSSFLLLGFVCKLVHLEIRTVFQKKICLLRWKWVFINFWEWFRWGEGVWVPVQKQPFCFLPRFRKL